MIKRNSLLTIACLAGWTFLAGSISHADVVVIDRGGPGPGMMRPHPRIAEVEARIADTNARIDQGIRSGELVHREAASLRREGRRIKDDEVAMVRANGGFLTEAQLADLNSRLDVLSARIYNKKHNDVVR